MLAGKPDITVHSVQISSSSVVSPSDHSGQSPLETDTGDRRCLSCFILLQMSVCGFCLYDFGELVLADVKVGEIWIPVGMLNGR